ncbi:MAG: hypothetical protein GWO24_19845, partial [Akkermansiaceae bacterium]|nr:hypothetical protein [Akkermansiaceae bacterium]
MDGPLHRFPFLAVLSAGCASMSLGIAQAAFEAVLRIVEGNPTTDSGPPLPERAVVHSALAEAEGEIEAARLFLHSAVGSVWEECQEGKPSPLESARLYRA